ncbi:MAG TPA: M48 family metallopeptidase [Thermomicrobiales bacterium]|nr:M48 family metallopeptidase [Thermomicrobiales bacterium]
MLLKGYLWLLLRNRNRSNHGCGTLHARFVEREKEPSTRTSFCWASCSTNGRLNFNDELTGMDRELGDYVIVHELLHFSAPNHGRLWKMLMRVHLGDYERLEARLRTNPATELKP